MKLPIFKEGDWVEIKPTFFTIDNPHKNTPWVLNTSPVEVLYIVKNNRYNDKGYSTVIRDENHLGTIKIYAPIPEEHIKLLWRPRHKEGTRILIKKPMNFGKINESNEVESLDKEWNLRNCIPGKITRTHYSKFKEERVQTGYYFQPECQSIYRDGKWVSDPNPYSYLIEDKTPMQALL